MSIATPPKQYDVVGQVETRGVDFIPNSERHSSPMNIVWILTGGSLALGIIVLGWLPVSFGLGWWPAFWSIIVGNLLGASLLTPFSMIGPHAGTNGPVASGAFFGVAGRMLGSIIGIVGCVGYFALSVWTGGEAAVAGLHRLIDLPNNNVTMGAAYAVIAFICVVVAIYGHASMVAVQRLLVPVAGLLLLVGVFVYMPHFSAAFPNGKLLLGAFWPTWLLAVTITAITSYGYAPFISDWTRYISPTKYSPAAIMGATWIGTFVGMTVPLTFGAFTAVAVASISGDWVTGLVTLAPTWYLFPLVLIGVVGSFGQGTICLYGSGLDFASIVPALKRPFATLVLSMIALALVYLGTMVWNAENSLTAFLQVDSVVMASWLAIVLVGHFKRGGYYNVHDLQVFNHRETGGVYWYTGGWNFRALTAFLVGSIFGALALQCNFYTGPLANIANGVDLSWISALLIGGALYYVLLLIAPEHAGVHGNAAADEAAEIVAQTEATLS
jgi:purine-cytosine permease-like protein